MDLDSRRVTGALIDGKRYASNLQRAFWIAEGFWIVVLSDMAYFAISDKWMIVTASIAVSSTIGSVIIPAIRRFDAGRSYLENTCHEIEVLIHHRG